MVVYAFDDIRVIIFKIKSACIFIESLRSKILYQQICKRFDVRLKKMPEDVENRWDSTNLLLHVATAYKNIIDVFIAAFN